MGFSNGNLTSKAVKVEKGERENTGEGFSLTVDSHFHIKNKRLTNVSPRLTTTTLLLKNSWLIY